MKVVECRKADFYGLHPEVVHAARLLGLSQDRTATSFLQGVVLSHFPENDRGLGVYRDGDIYVDALGGPFDLRALNLFKTYTEGYHPVTVVAHSYPEMNPDAYRAFRGASSSGILFRAPRNR